MNRHLSRIIVMQTLYELDFRSNENPLTVLERNREQFDAETDDEYIKSAVTGVTDGVLRIDPLIQSAAPEWPIDQIAVIDKIILRLAVYELLIERTIPPKVVINEAVELAKAFGSDNSSKFINGVLGTLYRNSDLPKESELEEMFEKNEIILKSEDNTAIPSAHSGDDGVIDVKPGDGGEIIVPEDEDLQKIDEAYQN